MKVYVIAAVAADRGIGAMGDLLYHIKADLQRFKSLTIGKTVVMGRRTFESLPKGALPGRRNIVVTHRHDFTAPGVEVAHSLPEAIAMSQTDVYIIGGASIYAQAMPLADGMLLTEIEACRTDADTYFPEFGAEWTQVSATEADTDPKSGVVYRFADYEKTCATVN